MNKTALYLGLGISLTTAMPAFSGSREFALFDLDQDGNLSIVEARSAFPSLLIVDVNEDGFLNRSEAEYGLKSLDLPPESSCQDDRVHAYEFQRISEKLEESDEQMKQELLGLTKR